MESEFYTVKQLSEKLGMPAATIYSIQERIAGYCPLKIATKPGKKGMPRFKRSVIDFQISLNKPIIQEA